MRGRTMVVQPDLDLLRDLAIIVVAAMALGLVVRPFRTPAIVGFLAAGVLLGPVTGILEVSEATEGIAEAGIILLLFLLGLELSLKRIRHLGWTPFFLGAAQMAGSAAMAGGVALLFGLPAQHALFVGLALMYSSTVVVVKLLEGKGHMGRPYGELAIGVLLVQDLAVVVVLALVTASAGGDGTSVPVAVGLAVGGVVLLAAITAAAARYLLPGLFHWIAHYPQALVIWSLAWCFLFVAAADLLGLSAETGAFLAGISLAQLPYHEHLHQRVHPLMNFLLAVFFVFLGLKTDPVAALDAWPMILALLATVMIGKPLLVVALLARTERGPRTALLTAITLSQSSEFSLILGALALGLGLIDEVVFSVVGVIALISMALSARLMGASEALAERAADLVGRLVRTGADAGQNGDGDEDGDDEGRRGHVILVGVNALAERLAGELRQRKYDLVLIDERLERLEPLPCDTVLGDASYEPVLARAGLDGARLLVSTVEDEELNSLLVYRCRQHGVPCSLLGYDRTILAELRVEGADHVTASAEAERGAVLDALRRAGALAP